MTTYYQERAGAFIQPLIDAREDLIRYLGLRYGQSAGPGLYELGLSECRAMIGTLPDIGSDANPLTFSLVGAAIALGWYRALRAAGATVDQAGKDVYGIFAIIMPSLCQHDIPAVTPGEVRKTKNFCEWTAKREYPENFVVDFVEGDDTCAYGMDIRECAVIRLCDRHGAREFVPYICLIDRLVFAARGVGLTRTSTLAGGGPCCDFRIRNDPKIELKEPFSAEKLREWGISG